MSSVNENNASSHYDHVRSICSSQKFIQQCRVLPESAGHASFKTFGWIHQKFGYTDQKGWCILYLNEFLVLATKFRFVDAQLLCNKHRVFSMAGKNLDFYNIF